MDLKTELKRNVDSILEMNEKDLKVPQLIVDIARDIQHNILSCEICADADDIESKARGIRNILQIMDRNKWDWEYYTLKNIYDQLNKMI
jgi:hypothetical protein